MSEIMGGKGKFNDFGWHNEFRSVNRKKEKAADCIYLDEDRTCNCKKCMYYLGKCFYSTFCPFREKEKIAEAKKEPYRLPEEKITEPVVKKMRPLLKCPLSVGAKITTKHGQKGQVIGIDYTKNRLVIQFEDNDEPTRFLYPDAFEKGFLIAEKEFQTYIMKQIQKSLK